MRYKIHHFSRPPDTLDPDSAVDCAQKVVSPHYYLHIQEQLSRTLPLITDSDLSSLVAQFCSTNIDNHSDLSIFIDCFIELFKESPSPQRALDCIRFASEAASFETIRQILEDHGFLALVSSCLDRFGYEFFTESCVFLSKSMRIFDERIFRTFVALSSSNDASITESIPPVIFAIIESCDCADANIHRRFVKPLASLIDSGEFHFSILACDHASRMSSGFCRHIYLSRVPHLIITNLDKTDVVASAMLFLARVFERNPSATNLAKDLNYTTICKMMTLALNTEVTCAAVRLLVASSQLKPIPEKLLTRIREQLVVLALLDSTTFILRRTALIALCRLRSRVEDITPELCWAIENCWWADDFELTRETLMFFLDLPKLPEPIQDGLDALQHLRCCGNEEIETMASQCIQKFDLTPLLEN